MGVNLYLEDEDGAHLAEVLDPHGYVTAMVALVPDGHTTCLQFIDPYGDTKFNRLQMPVLIRELENTRASVTEPRVEQLAKEQFGSSWQAEVAARELSASAIRAHLDQVLGLARRCQVDVHTYLTFYGD